MRKKRASGVIFVKIKTPAGVQWLSTGQTSYTKAREVVDMAMVDRLQMAACANALTPDVISRLTTGRRFTCLDVLAAWKEEATPDLSPDTLANYETLLRQFFDETDHGNSPLSAVRRSTLGAWVNEKGVAVGSRRARLAAMRTYYKFASAAGYCVGNPAARVTVQVRDLFFAELEPKETLPLTPEEYALLMASPKLMGFYRCATALAYWLGLRLRDVACLEWASFQGDRVIVWTKKRGVRVSLPIDDPLLGAGELRKILLEMMEQQSSASRFCFPSMRSVALDTKKRAKLSVQYQRMLHTHGITDKRFHSLRHAAAMRLDNAGKTLEEIGEVLGHSSTATTEIYTDH